MGAQFELRASLCSCWMTEMANHGDSPSEDPQQDVDQHISAASLTHQSPFTASSPSRRLHYEPVFMNLFDQLPDSSASRCTSTRQILRYSHRDRRHKEGQKVEKHVRSSYCIQHPYHIYQKALEGAAEATADLTYSLREPW